MKTLCILSILSILSTLSISALAQPAIIRQRAAQLRSASPSLTMSPLQHPWRVINSVTNFVTPEWSSFGGTVVGVHPKGILIRGWADGINRAVLDEERDLFIFHFPFRAAEGDVIYLTANYRARLAGTYTFTTAIGGSRTVRQLDYGIPCDPPRAPEPTATEKLAAQILSENRKAAADAATLKFHLERAQAGNEMSQRRLAELYLQRGDTNAATAWLRAASTNAPSLH